MTLQQAVTCVVQKTMCRNIYTRLDGTLSPMPFDTKCYGMWHFDGQFFYQKRGKG